MIKLTFFVPGKKKEKKGRAKVRDSQSVSHSPFGKVFPIKALR